MNIIKIFEVHDITSVILLFFYIIPFIIKLVNMNIVTRLVTVDGYWIDNRIYCTLQSKQVPVLSASGHLTDRRTLYFIYKIIINLLTDWALGSGYDHFAEIPERGYRWQHNAFRDVFAATLPANNIELQTRAVLLSEIACRLGMWM
jgi:hypothetical protein